MVWRLQIREKSFAHARIGIADHPTGRLVVVPSTLSVLLHVWAHALPPACGTNHTCNSHSTCVWRRHKKWQWQKRSTFGDKMWENTGKKDFGNLQLPFSQQISFSPSNTKLLITRTVRRLRKVKHNLYIAIHLYFIQPMWQFGVIRHQWYVIRF